MESASKKSARIIVILNPSAGIVLSPRTALLTSLAILITNDYISKLKLRYTKLPDWKIVLPLKYEKSLKKSMVDKKLMKKNQWN